MISARVSTMVTVAVIQPNHLSINVLAVNGSREKIVKVG